MDERILFNPDNRLLGSSTGDLGLYGGQTDPGIDVHPLRDGGSAGLTPASNPGSALPEPPVNESPAATAPAFDPDPISDPSDGIASLTPQSFLTTPATFQPVALPAQGRGGAAKFR